MKSATPWLILLLLPLSALAEDPIIGAFGIRLGKPDGQPFDAEIEEFCIIRGNPQTYTCEYTTNKPNAMFNEKVSVLHSNRSDRKILMITANGKENHLSESTCKANLEKIKTTLISKYRGNNREIKLGRGGFGLIISNKKKKSGDPGMYPIRRQQQLTRSHVKKIRLENTIHGTARRMGSGWHK